MPRFPLVAPSVAAIGGSIYTALSHRLSTFEGEIYPLHIGDTWMEPAVGLRMEDLRTDEHPGMHRYSQPQGLPELLDAIAERTVERTSVPTTREHVLVAAGATGALGAVVGTLVEPGDEVLILAPHWPLIAGIVRSFHGTPVAVPFIGRVDSPESAIEAVTSSMSSRTVALYLSTPNNPTGRMIPRQWIEALARWCARHDLWLIADEVYEDYAYRGGHSYTRPMAPERAFSVHSFSKAYGMAGNRCGYVVGPRDIVTQLRKVSTHTFYSTPTASQLAALKALQGLGDAWVAEARKLYREMGEAAADTLQVAHPEGSTFLFLDVADCLDERGLMGFLEDCVERGLFVAPGPSFGPYPTHIRVCYTAAPPEIVKRGIAVLAERLTTRAP
jgi:aspartate/methionine/tyrosine aminotransferase